MDKGKLDALCGKLVRVEEAAGLVVGVAEVAVHVPVVVVGRALLLCAEGELVALLKQRRAVLADAVPVDLDMVECGWRVVVGGWARTNVPLVDRSVTTTSAGSPPDSRLPFHVILQCTLPVAASAASTTTTRSD